MKKRNVKTRQENLLVEHGIDLAELSDARYASMFYGRTSEHTLLRHVYIYGEYIKVRKEMTRMFPELAEFLPKKYYYIVLSCRFSLTPNYICSILCNLRRRGSDLVTEVEEAKRKIANDDYSKYFTRK